MRVDINAGGRQVTVDCSDTNVTVRDILAEALDAWKATEGAKDDNGPATYGFSAERRGDSGYTPLNGGYMREPKA